MDDSRRCISSSGFCGHLPGVPTYRVFTWATERLSDGATVSSTRSKLKRNIGRVSIFSGFWSNRSPRKITSSYSSVLSNDDGWARFFTSSTWSS
jgi:hypothetical protein